MKKGSIASLTVALVSLFAAASASALMPNCTPGLVTALDVANMTITAVNPVTSRPEFCQVKGFVTTSGFGAPNGSAGFEVRMPAVWNHKFAFWGVGGLAGSAFLDIAVTPSDFFHAVAQGYAMAITDQGHQAGPTDARWGIVAPGVPDTAKVTDYYFRATHEVTVAAKQLVERFYKAPIQRAYFDGCSNGGRMAMVEATRFPGDYDGIIAGAPFMDIRTVIGGVKQQKVQLQSIDAYIPPAKLAMIDAAVYGSCDAADGVADSLIQNPAVCAFDPDTLVTSACAPSDATCLTAQQADTLRSYFTALRDERGHLSTPARRCRT